MLCFMDTKSVSKTNKYLLKIKSCCQKMCLKSILTTHIKTLYKQIVQKEIEVMLRCQCQNRIKEQHISFYLFKIISGRWLTFFRRQKEN